MPSIQIRTNTGVLVKEINLEGVDVDTPSIRYWLINELSRYLEATRQVEEATKAFDENLEGIV